MIQESRQNTVKDRTFNGAARVLFSSPLNPNVIFPGNFNFLGISVMLLTWTGYELFPQSFHVNCSILSFSWDQNYKQLHSLIKKVKYHDSPIRYVSQEKIHHILTCNVTKYDFNFFTCRRSSKFVVKSSLKIPPHFTRVATRCNAELYSKTLKQVAYYNRQ